MDTFVRLNGRGVCPRCRKVGYLTQREAGRRLKDICQKPKGLKVPARVYFSTACGWWHLTSKPRKKRSAGR